MNRRYRNFRSYGHGPVISFLHAVPFWWIVALAILVGLSV